MGVAEIGMVLLLALLVWACLLWVREKHQREDLQYEISLMKEQLTRAFPQERDE